MSSSSTKPRSGTKRSSSAMFSSDQISATCKNKTGFNTTYEKIRSILMHPIGMLLTSILNNMARLWMPDEFWSELLDNSTLNKDELMLVQDDQDDTDLSDLDCVFAAAMLQWDGAKEKQLTDDIHSYIDALSSKGRIKGFGDQNNVNSVKFEQEKYAAGEAQACGRVDFIVVKEISGIDSTAKMPAEIPAYLKKM